MNKFRALIFIILLFLFGGVNASQQLETVVYPSEDEIREAFELGEISYEQYIILLELIINGIDEHSLYLLDEIPITFTASDKSLQSELDNNVKPFLEIKKSSDTRLLIKHRFASYIEDDASSKYQTSFRYSYGLIDSELKIRREYSGRERVIRRFVTFSDLSNSLKQFTLGNYSKRFGLGALFGYHGKMISFSEQIDRESFLFPDYGGYNGLYSKWKISPGVLESLYSINHDSLNSVSSFGLSLKNERNKSQTALIVGFNKIKNRINNKSILDFKTSLFNRFEKKFWYISTEFAFNRYKENQATAIIAEGAYSHSTAKVSYAFWHYGNSYLDLSSGSKTSLISEKIYLDEIQYDFFSRRVGQTGGVIKTNFQIDDKIDGSFSLLHANKNSDSTETEIFWQIAHGLTEHITFSADVLNRIKIRRESDADNNQTKTKYRLQMKYRTGQISCRSYLLYTKYDNQDDKYGFFSEVRYKSTNYGNTHFWFNLGQFDRHRSQINYLYLFVKNEKNISDYIKLGFKFSHRYDRSASNKYENQFSIDLSYRL